MSDKMDKHPESMPVARSGRKSWIWTLLVCIIILGVGIAGARTFTKTAPQAQRRPPERTVALVETQALFPDTHQVRVTAMGSVIPAKEMTLRARVSGAILSMHPEFVEGGVVRAGETVLKIDPQDFELALARKQSAVVNAEYELQVEKGYQEVARREWSLLGPGQGDPAVGEDLVLRKPHLAKVQSDLAAALAELEQARLDLSRTDVAAPFNAVVRKRHVAIGSQVSSQEPLAELVGTDVYWIRVTLPVDQLAWIRIPRSREETGAAVTVFDRGVQRQGTVLRLLSDLEPDGRMARILVSIEDPLGLQSKARGSVPPMLLGEVVRVEIQGSRLQNVFRISRSALRDNATIWVLSDDDTLKIIPVETLWRDADHVLIQDGIRSGQRLIVTDLTTPVNGMPLSDASAENGEADVTPNPDDSADNG